MKPRTIERAHQVTFKPNKAQINQIANEVGCARLIYNHMLDLVINDKRLTFNDLCHELTAMKKSDAYEFLNNATNACLQQAIRNLESGRIKHRKYQRETSPKDKAKHLAAHKNNCKDKICNSCKYGLHHPQFKSKYKAKKSIRYPLDQRLIDNNFSYGSLIKLPKLGKIAGIRWPRNRTPSNKPKMMTLTITTSNKYVLSFMTLDVIQSLPRTKKAVGLDVGIKSICVTSDNDLIENQRYYKRYRRKLTRAQRKLKRKTKSSNGWMRAKIRIAKIHEKIAYCRHDFIHKMTRWIIETYDLISIEDLAIKNLMKNKRLAKHIADCSWFEIRRQLQYKANYYGKCVIVISRYFASTKKCSDCDLKHDMPLNKRTMRCICGLVLDRDYNAAINIRNEGIKIFKEDEAAGLAVGIDGIASIMRVEPRVHSDLGLVHFDGHRSTKNSNQTSRRERVGELK